MHRLRRIPLVVAIAGALLATALPADAARTRSGGGEARASRGSARPAPHASGRSAAPRAVPRHGATRATGRSAAKPTPPVSRSATAAPSRSGTERTRASGHATYGYGYSSYYPYHPYYPYYPYYGYSPYYDYPYQGWYWGLSWYWGWPYTYGDWTYAPGPTVVRPGESDAGGPPGLVETDVRPKSAEVWIDGGLRGEARDFNGRWDAMLLEPGLRAIEFREDGYQTLRLVLDVRSGRDYLIDERLQKGEGLDPRSDAEPPAPSATEVWSGSIDSVAPTEPAPAASGALRTGLLRIDASPADAAVYLDGTFLARADELARLHGALPVAPGRHRVEVVRPGYEPERREVEVAGDEPVSVRFELRPGR